jgi:hypothetical protein
LRKTELDPLIANRGAEELFDITDAH